MSMFESKVYECEICKQFFFFKLDADDHKHVTGHSNFKVTDWKSSASTSPRINRSSNTHA
jgi:hypothetical protein